jgi:hypothetical protein
MHNPASSALLGLIGLPQGNAPSGESEFHGVLRSLSGEHVGWNSETKSVCKVAETKN